MPVVDHFINSKIRLLYYMAFGSVGVVHHFERAWSAGTDWLKTVPLRDLTRKHSGGGATTSAFMKNVYKITSSREYGHEIITSAYRLRT